MGKTPSSHIIHSLGGEYCWIVRDSEPIRLLKSPRSLSVYILIRHVLGPLSWHSEYHNCWHSFRTVLYWKTCLCTPKIRHNTIICYASLALSKLLPCIHESKDAHLLSTCWFCHKKMIVVFCHMDISFSPQARFCCDSEETRQPLLPRDARVSSHRKTWSLQGKSGQCVEE